MNCVTCEGVLWRLSFILCVLLTCSAQAQQPPVVVRALPITEADGQVWHVNVSLGNVSQTNLTSVKLSLLPAEGATWTIPALAPGQWKSDTIDLKSGAFTSLVAFVEYNQDGTLNAVAAPVQMPERSKPWWSGLGPAIIPVGVGALLALLGVLLTSVFNANKERLTARLQWSRFLVEHYDSQYREFLTRCASTFDPTSLENHFKSLDGGALVPEGMRQRIVRGLNAVRDATTADAKRVARDGLLQEVRSELLEPFRRQPRR